MEVYKKDHLIGLFLYIKILSFILYIVLDFLKYFKIKKEEFLSVTENL